MKPTRLRVWTPYILPNILTSLNMIAGFYAIIQTLNHNYMRAVWAVLLAVVLDGLDGMAARLTRGSSAFGLEFDSMADLISFGLAPTLFMYLWVLRPYGRIGWVAAFLFMACGVLRLARFNVQSHDLQKNRFLGVPIPMAAAQVVTTYLMTTHLELKARSAGPIVIITAYLVAFLMISNLPYRSLKAVNVRKRHSFYVPVLFILAVAIVFIYPQVILWLLASLYVASGPAEYLIRRAFPALTRAPGGERGQAGAKDKPGRSSHG